MFNRFKKSFLIPDWMDLLKIGVGCSVLLILIFFPTKPEITRAIYQPSGVNLAALFIFFYLLFRKTKNIWGVLQASFIFALFSIPLIYKWQFAHYDGEIIGGLLPWSDASTYYTQAYRLTLGFPFTAWGGRRPLFAALLAVLLEITGGDFMASLVVLTLINAAAVTVAAFVVRRYYGAGAGAVYVIIAFEFYSRYAGKTLTEQLGFALGNLALYFLLSGVQSKIYSRALFGLGVLTLALNVRAGALFILPVLFFWLAWFFRKQSSFWRIGLSALLVVILGFLVNFGFARLITGQSGTAFSNYSYVLYGLASGNKGWTHVFEDYPTITEAEIMPLAINKIREHPDLFVEGVVGSYKDYFDLYIGAFSFIFAVSDKANINLLFWCLALIGTLFSFFRKSIEAGTFVSATFLGVFSSLTLLPPIDADAMRAFAATIPFTALWVAAGVSGLSWLWHTYIRRDSFDQMEMKYESSGGRNFADYFSTLLILLMIPAPLLVKVISDKPAFEKEPSLSSVCGTDSTTLEGVVFESTSVILIDNNDAAESYMPYIRIDDFRNPIKNSSYPFLESELIALEPGDQISFGVARPDSNSDFLDVWFISKYLLPEGEFSNCARPTLTEWLRNYRFYYLDGMPDDPDSLSFSQAHPVVLNYFRLFYNIIFYLVLAVLLLNLVNGEKMGIGNLVYNLILIYVIAQAVFMWFYVRGIISPPFAIQRIVLNSEAAVLDQGNSYTLPLGTRWMSQSSLGSSPAIVYEDSVPLGFPNTIHQDIRDVGQGRYSVWDGYLYFSSSDNTDPRTNRRNYEIEWNYPVAPFFEWLSYLAGGLGVSYIALLSLRDNNVIKLVFKRTSALNSSLKKNVSNVRLSPTRHLLYGGGFLLLMAMGYYFHPSDIFWYKLTIDKDQITRDETGGFGYVAYMGYKLFSAHENKESNAVLLENGENLGPSNALLDRISRNGSGRYMFLDGYLYFSTSDNSDPRGNDREYTLALPLRMLFVWHISFYIIVIYTAAFGLVWREKHES